MQRFKQIVKWGGIPVGFLMSAVGVADTAMGIATWGVPVWVWYLIGLLILATSSIFIIIGFCRENKSLKKQGEKQGALGIEYYENRSKLPKIKEEFADTSVGYALWFTGYEARNYWPVLKDRIKKLILINPQLCNQQPFLSHIADIWEKTPKDAIDCIEGLSQEAKSDGIDVRWINEKPNELIFISNPHTDNAWLRIEYFDLSKHASEWNSVRVYKKYQPLLFSTILSKYEHLLDISEAR